MSCGVGRRCSSEPALLWRRPAAAAPVQPLAWQLPHATGAALKSKKKERERERKEGKGKKRRKEGREREEGRKEENVSVNPN